MGNMKEFHCKQAHWCKFGRESKRARIKQWVHYLPFCSTFALSETIAIAGCRHFVLTNNTSLFFPAIAFCHSGSKLCSQRSMIVQPNKISNDTVISSGVGNKRTISSQNFITGTIRTSTLEEHRTRSSTTTTNTTQRNKKKQLLVVITCFFSSASLTIRSCSAFCFSSSMLQ